jgi:tripartite-type tricarboxylate transporter receptor subunit TctC
MEFLTYVMEVNLMQQYEDLKVLVAEIEADVNKAEGGNKAAGTRVRKQMQRIKQAAQAVRSAILEIRSAQ